MSDIVNQIKNDTTGENELWITVKDASDLLGFSERHAWSKIKANGLQTKKLLNQHRKKLYVLRADIEQFHKAEQERQRLEALQASPLSEMSEMSEKKRELEMSERGLSPLSESGSFHTDISDRALSLPSMLQEAQKRQEALIVTATRWKMSALWACALFALFIGFLSLSLYEMKKALSESRKALSERETNLSESRRALSEMSERAFLLSEREKEALKTGFEREGYIKRLEAGLAKDKLEELKKE